MKKQHSKKGLSDCVAPHTLQCMDMHSVNADRQASATHSILTVLRDRQTHNNFAASLCYAITAGLGFRVEGCFGLGFRVLF